MRADQLVQVGHTIAALTTRAQLFQQMLGQLNEDGPFFPVLQPGRVIVVTKDITTIQFNPTWSIYVAAVSG